MRRVLAAVLALPVLAGCGGGGHSDGGGDESPRALLARIPRIERQVESLRGLRYRRPVHSQTLTAAQTRRQALADFDHTTPPRERHATEAVLKLLRLLPPDGDLRKISAAVFGEQVAGFYDLHAKKLTVVTGGQEGNRALDGIILSHELTHALEDQHFHLPEGGAGTDDRDTARQALSEGTATEIMERWAAHYLSGSGALGGALDALGSGQGQTKLPRYIQDGLEFPYLGGMAFVEALRTAAGGGWRLVNEAETTRPPVSTEQILHPEKWLHPEAPLPVRFRVGLGPGWRRAVAGSLGEWDTREILLGKTSADVATAAATGWGGGRYELWERGGRKVLALGWRWDTEADRRQFAPVLAAWARLALGPRTRYAVASGPRTTGFAIAPSAALARRVARRAAR